MKNSLTRVVKKNAWRHLGEELADASGEEISGSDGATAGRGAGRVGIVHGLNRWRCIPGSGFVGRNLAVGKVKSVLTNRRNLRCRSGEIRRPQAAGLSRYSFSGGGLVTPKLRKERRRGEVRWRSR
ncbi:MAG: hypothetical protein IJE66_01595 [Akkermansia sp.]|nr:hypothetical protein [Akkermansia sp.]